MTARTYVVADLHGRHDLLEQALAQIESNAPGRVVFTGDYIDRGPQSRDVIARLFAGPQQAGWRWTCLKGNHEAMLIDALADASNARLWLDNGGEATLASYRQSLRDFRARGLADMNHAHWIAGLPLYYQDAHRVYVHAGVDPQQPLLGQTPGTLMWKRYRAGADEGLGDRHVVHGHDPVPNGPLLLHNRTNLDTGAVFTNRLVVGVFDDDAPGGPIALIECIL